MAEEWVGLRETLRGLRAELTEAMTESRHKTLRFELGPIELELAVTVTRDDSLEGGLKFGVLSFGAHGGESADTVHRLKLVLNPVHAATGRAPEVSARVDAVPDR